MAIFNRIPDQSASENYAQAMERAMLKSQQAGQQVEAVQRIRLVSGCLLYRVAPHLWRGGKARRQACRIVSLEKLT